MLHRAVAGGRDARAPTATPWGTRSAAPTRPSTSIVDRVAVGPVLEALPERERTILYLRFFRGMTQSGIAEQLGISQMHVSRLLSSCFAQLREEVLAEAPAEAAPPGTPSLRRRTRGSASDRSGRGRLPAAARISGGISPERPQMRISSATLRSLMFVCWETSFSTSHPWSGVTLPSATTMPIAWSTTAWETTASFSWSTSSCSAKIRSELVGRSRPVRLRDPRLHTCHSVRAPRHRAGRGGQGHRFGAHAGVLGRRPQRFRSDTGVNTSGGRRPTRAGRDCHEPRPDAHPTAHRRTSSPRTPFSARPAG